MPLYESKESEVEGGTLPLFQRSIKSLVKWLPNCHDIPARSMIRLTVGIDPESSG